MSYARFIQYLFAKYHTNFRKDDVIKLYHFFQKSQYWSEEDLRYLQIEKFKLLLRHCIDNVPYYQQIFREKNLSINDFNKIEDLSKLPFLTKTKIRENRQNLVAKNISENRYKKNSTSGSTGESLFFYSDKQAETTKAALNLRNFEWMKINFFCKQLWIWGSPFDIRRSKAIYQFIKANLIRKKMISSYFLEDKNIEKILNTINQYKPEFIGAYPSHMQYISNHHQRMEMNHFPKVIQLSGEKLYSEQRRDIQQCFKSDIYDYYGARDGSLIAHECEKHTGQHVLNENVIVEIIDAEEKTINNGKGEIVITDLHNYCMPFIRYKIGDLAKITKNDKCDCGRQLTLVEEIIGRKFDIINFPNGNSVGGTFWSLLMKNWKGIKTFRVVQTSKYSILIYFVEDLFFTKSILIDIKKKILEYSGPKLDIVFEKVEVINNYDNGKFQFVKSLTSEKR